MVLERQMGGESDPWRQEQLRRMRSEYNKPPCYSGVTFVVVASAFWLDTNCLFDQRKRRRSRGELWCQQRRTGCLPWPVMVYQPLERRYTAERILALNFSIRLPWKADWRSPPTFLHLHVEMRWQNAWNKSSFKKLGLDFDAFLHIMKLLIMTWNPHVFVSGHTVEPRWINLLQADHSVADSI